MVGGVFIVQKYAILYEKGKRENNQDSITLQKIYTSIGEVLVAVVCDGIGGMDEGEIASGYCIEEINNWFYSEFLELLKRRTSIRAVRKSLLREMFYIHGKIKLYGKQKNIHLGTTVSMILIWKNNYLVLHIGDSKVMISKHTKRKDELIYQNYKDCQKATNLDRCIGCGKYYEPDFKIGKLKKNMSIMLMSDGLNSYITEETVSLIMKHKRKEKMLNDIATLALKRGEKDNMSCIFLQISDNEKNAK